MSEKYNEVWIETALAYIVSAYMKETISKLKQERSFKRKILLFFKDRTNWPALLIFTSLLSFTCPFLHYIFSIVFLSVSFTWFIAVWEG